MFLDRILVEVKTINRQFMISCTTPAVEYYTKLVEQTLLHARHYLHRKERGWGLIMQPLLLRKARIWRNPLKRVRKIRQQLKRII